MIQFPPTKAEEELDKLLKYSTYADVWHEYKQEILKLKEQLLSLILKQQKKS